MALRFEQITGKVQSFFFNQGLDRTYWVAFSGGLDSQVLLHICATWRADLALKIRAIHINHGLSPHADHWQTHCAKVCSDLQVAYTQENLDLQITAGQSFEAIARQKRYQLFAEILAPDDFLLTAHHQDDQAETVLLQLLRGAGPKGLSGMPIVKSLGQGFHGRPLLHVTRAELKHYADYFQLTWIDDESNGNTHFTRNFLRHDILPLLKKRWPRVEKTLARVAENCAETQELLEKLTANDLKWVQEVKKNTLSIAKLQTLDPVRQRFVLRAWLQSLNFAIPSRLKLQQIQHDFLGAKQDKSPYIFWDHIELRRYRDALYAMERLSEPDAQFSSSWNLLAPLKLPHGGSLQAFLTKDKTFLLRKSIHQVTVRFRQGGERCQLSGRDCHHELKKLFQTWGVPPWEREQIPLLYVENTLAAVVGYFLDERFAAKEGEEGYWISK